MTDSGQELISTISEGDDDKLKELVVSKGSCTSDSRLRVWCYMLSVNEDERELPRPDDNNTMSTDIELMLGSIPKSNLTKDDVMSIVSDLCTHTQTKYKSEILDLCCPLTTLEGITPSLCSSVLRAITKHYSPLLFLSDESVNIYVLLFRLLLQYHDAGLSSHLDRNKANFSIVTTWLKSLYVDQLGLESVHPLWDLIIASGDALLPTYVGIAVLVMQRERLLESKGEENICSQLSQIPITSSVENLKEIYNKALAVKMATPPSVNMILARLFSPQADNSDLIESIPKLVALPIETEELISAFRKDLHTKQDRDQQPIKFMVLDCRAQKSFNFASLPTAVHVGPDVGYEPDKMKAVLDRFEGARGSHFCLLGTGRGIGAEQNLLNVIALRFISKEFNHIGITMEGFKGIIPFLKADTIEYVKQAPDEAPSQPSLHDTTDTGEKIMLSLKEQMKDIDTAALKKTAAEKAEKVKSWGRGFLSKWSKDKPSEAKPTTAAPATLAEPSSPSKSSSKQKESVTKDKEKEKEKDKDKTNVRGMFSVFKKNEAGGEKSEKPSPKTSPSSKDKETHEVCVISVFIYLSFCCFIFYKKSNRTQPRRSLSWLTAAALMTMTLH